MPPGDGFCFVFFFCGYEEISFGFKAISFAYEEVSFLCYVFLLRPLRTLKKNKSLFLVACVCMCVGVDEVMKSFFAVMFFFFFWVGTEPREERAPREKASSRSVSVVPNAKSDSFFHHTARS